MLTYRSSIASMASGNALKNPLSEGLAYLQDPEFQVIKGFFTPPTTDPFGGGTGSPETGSGYTGPDISKMIDDLINDPYDPISGKYGMMAYTSQKLNSLPTDLAVLNGGMMANDHINQVDAHMAGEPPPYQYGNETVCSSDSIIMKGLRALVESGRMIKKLVTDVIAAVREVIGVGVAITQEVLTAAGAVISEIANTIQTAVSTVVDAFKTAVDEATKALSDALATIKAKAFLDFWNDKNPCIQGIMTDVINTDVVNTNAIEQSRSLI